MKSEEIIAVEEILADEEECLSAAYAPNGVCPCCGAVVEYVYSMFNDAEYVQHCPSCDWESELAYDA